MSDRNVKISETVVDGTRYLVVDVTLDAEAVYTRSVEITGDEFPEQRAHIEKVAVQLALQEAEIEAAARD